MALAASIDSLSVIDHVGNIFTFCGGLGMFLYGMHIMSDGIQRSADDRMRQLLGILTNNRVLAILVGALITAIIQSSGATTVMVVGFVNAGLMGLGQAVGVIMGANIGTCITAWIVSMESLGDAFQAMSPSLYAPLLIGIGAFFAMFAKKQGKKLAGQILVGLGLLFLGLDFMKDGVSIYTELPIFINAFRLFGENPILGIAIGALVTALIQSSSASVGYPADAGIHGRRGHDRFRRLHQSWLQHRFLCDSTDFQRRDTEKRKAGRCDPSEFQCNRYHFVWSGRVHTVSNIPCPGRGGDKQCRNLHIPYDFQYCMYGSFVSVC